MNSEVEKERLLLIGQKIKQLRIDAGYTSYENFALDHGLERKQYWRLEEGANMTLSSLFRILDIHGITPAEFFRSIQH